MQKSKKKLLFVITKSRFGGAQRYVHELASGLKNTYDVSVACGGEGDLVTKLKESGVPVIPLRHVARDIGFVREIRAFFELYRIIQKTQPDIIHLNSSKAGALGAVAARFAGVERIIFTAHGWPFLEKRNIVWKSVAWIGSWVTALFTHHVIVVSANDKNHMHMPFVSSPSVIYTAVPDLTPLPSIDARLALSGSATVQEHRDNLWLGTIAELTQNKNLFRAIDAVDQYNRSHEQKIFYSIIGSGEQAEVLIAYIEKHCQRQYISLLGHIDNARKYLSAFDMFLLPSRKEGFPYVLLEAGISRVPVIASRVGGIPELIADKKTGLLIDPEDTHSMVQALNTFAGDEKRRSTYAEALYERVKKTHALSDMIEKTTHAYEA